MSDLAKIRIKEYYESKDDSEYVNLQLIFKKAFFIFIEENKNEDYDTLLCSIHDSFKKGHNCVACNLDANNQRIENFLIQHRYFGNLHLTFTTFILLLYLQVESIDEYFKIIQLQESYKLKHFQIFQEIKRWTNFLKHPKSFMLVHHPLWTFEGREIKDQNSGQFIADTIKRTNPTVDSEFVKNYYSGGKNNKDLYNLLHKKKDLIVVFPDPLRMIKKFMEAQKKFTEIILNNEIVRDLLENETTIESHFADNTEE